MTTRIISAVSFVWLALAVPALAAGTPKAMYESALARESAVRAHLADEHAAPAAVLKEVRAVENAYLAVVHRHPASSYSDDALWNAGRLALDAFARFGQIADRETGIHLLNFLAAQYPASKFARRVPAQLAALPSPPAATAAAEPDPPPTRSTTGSSEARTPASPSNVTQAGAPAAARALIKRVTRAVLPDVVRVTIEIDTEVPFHEERLDAPPRVFLDFPATRAAAGLVDKTLRFDGDVDVVRQIRIGRHPNATTRVVLDAAGISGYSVYPLYDPYRLVIDCARAGAAKTSPSVGALTPLPTRATGTLAAVPVRALPPVAPTLDGLRLSTNWGRVLPSMTPRAAGALQAARAEDSAIASAVATPAAPLVAPALLPPPARNSSGGFSMARQLGLGVSRIVIDPGHGGHDPGAKGKGVNEAELVLDVALRLEKLLQQQPGVEVVLTRRTDEFIPLQERPAIANREGADLFLSIHANASENAQARGIETYFLNFANNLSAAAVAARENAASGQAMAALPDFVKAIALNNKLDESRDFASEVQRTMIERLRGTNKTLRNLGVKQAPFVVLIGAAMPSVLAEISFVTNPQEARLLKGSAYRQRIAEALLAAIRKYQGSLRSVATVAHQ